MASKSIDQCGIRDHEFSVVQEVRMRVLGWELAQYKEIFFAL